MKQLLEIMAALRDPESGCPWDREQTFETILPYTIEEAYEVADAIERQEMGELRDELGDLLFQVVFYAQMAKERGEFEFDQVVESICDKMIRRHPHVFGDDQVRDAAHQSEAWERHKAAERVSRSDGASAGQLAGVARALPALIRAEKLQKRAAKVGFDWQSAHAVMSKVHEEIAELQEQIDLGDRQAIREEMGDLLFSCVNLARHLGVDAEVSLRDANAKFERRFNAMEVEINSRGGTLDETSIEQMDQIWNRVKGDA